MIRARARMLLLAAAMQAAALPALAHKIIASVYVAGDVIEGEIGFSDGTMAAGQLVEVLDATGARIGAVTTDGEGFFTFRPTTRGDHHFRADLGAGHVAQAVVLAADLNGDLPGAGAPQPQPIAPTGRMADRTAPPSFSEDDIAQMLRDELRPLRREITALREKNGLRDMLAGLGLIAGLFGLGFYLAARRQISGGGQATKTGKDADG